MQTSAHAWRSIQRKLPLSILLLLVAVVGLFSTLAYQGVKSNRLETAGHRLSQVARELADLTEQSVEGRIAYAERVAADARVVAAATRGDTNGREVQALFDSLSEATRNTTTFQLTSAAYPLPGAGIDISPETQGAPQGPVAGVGPIRVDGDSIFSETIAPVLDADSNVVGELRHSRRAASAEAVRDLLTELIGGDALFLVGNVDDDVWTDLVSSVDGPSVDVMGDTLAHRYVRGGAGLRYGAAARVENAPWVILVEFPLSTVLAPARDFLTTVSLIAFVSLAIGGIGASLLSRRLTVPLREATATAESMAAGDYGVRLNFDRSDEIGQLADAFDTMAERVEEAHHRLEDQVAERTSELNTTLEQLKATQDDLVCSEKLAILGQLSSGLGHELRNPLGVMSNAVYYLQAVNDGSNEKITQYLGIIQEQIGLSEGIISALLDYARAKTPVTQPVQLSTVVADQIRRLSPSDNVSLEVDVSDDIVVEADSVQLGQVLFNLLTNGKQAIENQPGTLSVVAYNVGDDRVAIEIADTGRGIPAESVNKIFEPLFTTKARGIGLGLSVTSSFVSLHGGTIEVASKEGEGSRFTIHWPAAVPVGAI